MATSYVDDPELSSRRCRDGWFWPGVVVRRRADGVLIVEGRKDDMMILNGINIFPAEIEQVLESHPAVAAAAALPLESPAHGHIPRCGCGTARGDNGERCRTSGLRPRASGIAGAEANHHHGSIAARPVGQDTAPRDCRRFQIKQE